MFDMVLKYFIDNGWEVSRHDVLPVLRMAYEGDNGNWICYARVREDPRQFIFLSVLSENVPESRRRAVAEFLTRANFGLNIGNFEMDFEDGEVRYKTGIDVTYDHLTPGLIESLVVGNLVPMDDYLPGISAVIAGDQSPAEAILKIRGDDDDIDLEIFR